jgi:AraC-like DNA-binding protein
VVAQLDPIRVWREEYARRWLKIDFEPLSDAPFHASFEPILVGMRIVRAAFSPGVTFRDEEMVKDGDDAFGLMIAQSGDLEITHQGRDLRLGHGDAALLHVRATGSVGSRQNFGYISVLIPEPEFATRGARPGDALMHHLPRRSEVLQLLRGYLRSLERSRFSGSAEGRDTIRRHIIDLAALALTPHGAVGESGLSAVVAARLSSALDHIAACFQNPELGVAAVAHSQGISQRYLQRLMETSGTSFTARVTELRLQRAFALLGEPGPGRISDIALEAGFSDISHFNRLFRARFGDTPGGVRAQAAARNGE